MVDFNTTMAETTTVTMHTAVDQLTGEDTFEVFFRILIYVVGVIGNLLVIFVILFLGEFRKITHWYVLQLALADLLFLQTLPFKVSEKIQNRWIYPVELCQAKQTILFFNYYASILFLMIMAIDRYLAVCHALSNRVQRMRSRLYSYVVTGITWAVALIICIPVMMYSGLVGVHPACHCTLHFPKDPMTWCKKNMPTDVDDCFKIHFHEIHKETCIRSNPVTSSEENETSSSGDFYEWYDYGSGNPFSELFGIDSGSENATEEQEIQTTGVLRRGCYYDPENPGWHAFIYFNFVVMFIIPLLVISTCYAFIVYRLASTNVSGRRESTDESTRSSKSSSKRIWKSGRRKSSSASTGRSHREKRKVTVMCAALVLLFIICWLPFHSVHLAKIVGIRDGTEDFCAKLATTTSILAYLNSAFNPYLYNFLGTFQKRMKQIVRHKKMQSFLSATGLTRVGGRSSSVVSSSDGSKRKKLSVPNESRSESIPNEKMSLRALEEKLTSAV